MKDSTFGIMLFSLLAGIIGGTLFGIVIESKYGCGEVAISDDDLRAADRDRLKALEDKDMAHEGVLAEHVKVINAIVAEIQKMRKPAPAPLPKPEVPLPEEDLEPKPVPEVNESTINDDADN